jgi:hypothetical protein
MDIDPLMDSCQTSDDRLEQIWRVGSHIWIREVRAHGLGIMWSEVWKFPGCSGTESTDSRFDSDVLLLQDYLVEDGDIFHFKFNVSPTSKKK